MKIIVFIIGVICVLFGFFQGFSYFSDYNTLTQYGKGYVWGSVSLVVIGLILIYWGLKKKTNSKDQ